MLFTMHTTHQLSLCRTPARAKFPAFTLTELLIAVTIIGLLAALLFPVFARARENARRTTCLSNERQLGMAIMQYAADNDSYFPSNQTKEINGIWARQVFPYVKNTAVYHCPNDTTTEGFWTNSDSKDTYSVVSYGLNLNVTVSGVYKVSTIDKVFPAVSDSALAAPSRTVLAFEVSDATAALGDLPDNRHVACAPTGNGARDPLTPQHLYVNGCRPEGDRVFFGVRYATGALGKRREDDSGSPATFYVAPRHAERSNYLACDGHVVSLVSSSVSGGESQPAGGAHCDEDEVALPCGGKNTAAGTARLTTTLTFSNE